MNKVKRSKKQTNLKNIFNSRKGVLTLSLLLIFVIGLGVTIAYLVTSVAPITNTFTPAQVSCEVKEDFNSSTGVKSNVNVKNTSDTDAYIRVKLVTYRVNDKGDRIGGLATIPVFTPDTGWFLNGDYYYYKNPVAAGESPTTALINSMTLQGSYSDADGGKQVIEVMAEAIQAQGKDSTGKTAAELSWGIDPSTLN